MICTGRHSEAFEQYCQALRAAETRSPRKRDALREMPFSPSTPSPRRLGLAVRPPSRQAWASRQQPGGDPPPGPTLLPRPRTSFLCFPRTTAFSRLRPRHNGADGRWRGGGCQFRDPRGCRLPPPAAAAASRPLPWSSSCHGRRHGACAQLRKCPDAAGGGAAAIFARRAASW